MRFKDKLYKFMYGRYGVDSLYQFLFAVYIFLLILNLFFRTKVIFYIESVLVVVMFYRVFSRKIYKRNRENQIFLNIKLSFLRPFNNLKRNFKDRKSHVYKKCNKCKTTLRLSLPNKRGINHVVCPECKKRLTIFSFRKNKIEIIRNKKKGR